MKAFILFLSLFSFIYAEEGVKKVVFDLTSGDLGVFKQKVLSGISAQKSYYEGKLEELKAVVIVHGEGYKFFVKDLQNSPYKDETALQKESQEILTRTQSLVNTYNVEFLMCASGLNHHKIDVSNIYSFVKIIPNATIGLIDKQNEGYAYIPIAK
jgi:uncharacterized protein